VLPAANVFPLPDHISDEVGAILDPLGNATHTALSFDLVGEDVLITGAGPIGVMATAISQHIGARFVVVTDRNPYRLAMAEKLGADRAVLADETDLGEVMSDLGMTEGFDIGMEMSGSGAAFRVALLGIPPDSVTVDLNSVIFKGLVVKGIYGRLIFETWYKMAAMLQGGLDVSAVITHRLPATSFAEAFEVVASGKSGKVLLDWTT
jgi:threonine 3-dehydrogenase